MQITFNWIGGATFILSIKDLHIAVDPVLCEKGIVQDYFWFRSRRIEDPVYTEEDFNDIDLWLITHDHEDHLDQIGLSQISSSSEIVCNKNASRVLKKSGKEGLTVLSWRQTKTFDLKGYKIEVEAIPAIHGVNPLSALLAGKGNGYYLSITKGKEQLRIYLTGDTVYTNKAIKAIEGRMIDLLIPNMGAAQEGSWIMTLTLNAGMLKKMISRLNPEIVIPVHYGTFQHYKEPVEKIKAIGDERIKIVDVGSKTIFEIK